jgi:hypothetical protein
LLHNFALNPPFYIINYKLSLRGFIWHSGSLRGIHPFRLACPTPPVFGIIHKDQKILLLFIKIFEFTFLEVYTYSA